MNSKIKIWLGTTNLNEEDYQKYFELDYETEDFNSPDYKVCDFCKHIEDVWYDEDLIGIIPVFDSEVRVNELIALTPLSSKEREMVENDCLKLGIVHGNTAVFYSGETREIVSGEDFKGLKYIGEYSI